MEVYACMHGVRMKDVCVRMCVQGVCVWCMACAYRVCLRLSCASCMLSLQGNTVGHMFNTQKDVCQVWVVRSTM